MTDLAGHVAFTGSRHGITGEQKICIAARLERYQWLHHGDCFGGDFEAHYIARRLGLMIHIHPPIDSSRRAFCPANTTSEPKAFLVRNHDIVDATVELVAAPAGLQQRQRSGTWATIRYARKLRRMVTIIYPDGSLEFSP